MRASARGCAWRFLWRVYPPRSFTFRDIDRQNRLPEAGVARRNAGGPYPVLVAYCLALARGFLGIDALGKISVWRDAGDNKPLYLGDPRFEGCDAIQTVALCSAMVTG